VFLALMLLSSGPFALPFTLSRHQSKKNALEALLGLWEAGFAARP
jgi:hypothetical protein